MRPKLRILIVFDDWVVEEHSDEAEASLRGLVDLSEETLPA